MTTKTVYHLIIQKILIHPQQIGKILEYHINYVDDQLLKEMQYKANLLSSQGNQQAADFLVSLVTQLQEELILDQPANRQRRILFTRQTLGTSPTLQEYQSSQVSLGNFLARSSDDVVKEITNAKLSSHDHEPKEYAWSKWVAIILVIGFTVLVRYHAINSKVNESKPSEQKQSMVIHIIRFLG